ncbi:MAG: pentapeptide repeat-containing protein [Acidimicrobiales bacterium]|nr:pentapeptide repeat-containing protein [Acidimicrobiales bacterium]
MGGDEVVVRPDATGEVVIDLTEFNFGLDVIEVVAGETITFVLVNEGANEHEFMVGRNLQTTTLGYPNGFEHDLFEGLTPVVEPPGAGMFMGAGMDMSDMDMSDMDMSDMDMSDMDMSDMDMSDTDMSDTDMDGEEHADDMDMSDMDMSDTDMDGEEHADDMDMSDTDMSDTDMSDTDMSDTDMSDTDMDGEEHADDDGEAHAGFMVVRRAGEIARVTITIPDDALGTWEIGCFQGRGAHWDAGMRAKLVVLAA